MKLRGVAALAACLLASCTAYFNPSVDLVVHVRDEGAANQVYAALREFAQRHQLGRVPADTHAPMPEAARQLALKTTYYVPAKRPGEGRSLTLLDDSTGCKVVRMVEEGRTWNEHSQADLAELHAALAAIEGVTVEKGAEFVPDKTPGRGIDEYCSAPPKPAA
jgi:hypothetical protein